MAYSMPEVLHTPRLELRPWRVGQEKTLLTMMQQEREHLWRDFPLTLAMVTDEAGAAAYIRRAQEQRSAGVAFQYVLWDRAAATRCLGQVNLKEINWSPTTVAKSELAYWLAAAAQGQGLMQEAARAVIEAAFGNLPLVKVYALVKPENPRSRAVVEALGFRWGGRLRKESRTADPNGAISDADYFDLLAEEVT